jgi:cyclase
MQQAGAGEIFLNAIDKDGTYCGYDLELIRKVSSSLTIPLIACGGASSISDFSAAVNHGASAVAAGSMFVFQRPHNAVLISYPSQEDLKSKLYVAEI